MSDGRSVPARRVLLISSDDRQTAGISTLTHSSADLELAVHTVSCQAALRAVRRASPHIVVIGCSVSDTDCYTTARRLRQACPDSAIVLLTDDDNRVDMVDVLRSGVTHVIAANSRADQMLEALRGAAWGECQFSARVSPKVLRRVIDRALPASRPLLSSRQVQVLRLVSSGLTAREAAEQLKVSQATVERHLADVYVKLGVSSRSEAVSIAQQEGWLAEADATGLSRRLPRRRNQC